MSELDPNPRAPRFGTDGLRGRAGEPPMDMRTLESVGAALGLWLQRSGDERKRILCGDDGRASARWIKDSLIHGLDSTDCKLIDIGLTTTPALADLTRLGTYAAGIMISASHNPASDNGIKIFQADGSKLSDDAERHIEELIGKVELPSERKRTCPAAKPELLEEYLTSVAGAFPDLDLRGAKVVLDGANGGGSQLAPTMLRRLGAEVIEVACQPDGHNINDGCGATHPAHLGPIVQESAAVLGICLDGDGDRAIFVDERGAIHDGDNILATLAPFLHRRGELRNGYVVATIMSNLGLRKCLAEHGIQVTTTPVGDRHVSRCMREHGHSLGAEQSGHVLFDRGDHLCGDGLFTALMVLSLPGILQDGASGVLTAFPRYPQVLLNVAVDHKPPLEDVDAIGAAVADVERELGDDGRVVLRYSGTENLCRVMIEGPEATLVQAYAERLADVVKTALS